MALAIYIEDLLNKQNIESNHIEFKKDWNPVSIYRSVCAFANNFEDLGGGYILVGMDTDDETDIIKCIGADREGCRKIISVETK